MKHAPAVDRAALRVLLLSAFAAASIGMPSPAGAQHPMEVQRLSAEGDHLKALVVFELLPRRILTTDSRIAAAKSAWALGLNNKASDLFDAILRDQSLSADTRARLTLSRGILEFQEERYSEAALFAEKSISLLVAASPLRGRAYLLWGQSLSKERAFAAAEEKFLLALSDAAPADKAEVCFALGSVEVKLGKYPDAERHLKAIPTDHERAPATVRLLATIALDTHQEDRARFWIEKGRSDYPDAFLDSWGDYGLMQIELSRGELPSARKLLQGAQKQFPASDPWLVLMQAALEDAEWKQAQEGSRP